MHLYCIQCIHYYQLLLLLLPNNFKYLFLVWMYFPKLVGLVCVLLLFSKGSWKSEPSCRHVKKKKSEVKDKLNVWLYIFNNLSALFTLSCF